LAGKDEMSIMQKGDGTETVSEVRADTIHY